MSKQQSIQWVLQATPAAATEHILAAAQALKFKANPGSENQILVESPFSFRSNTFAGKYTGTVLADGDGAVVVWDIEGQGSNQPKNLQKLAEKLPAGLLVSSGPVIAAVAGAKGGGDAEYRAKHGIPAESFLAVGVGGYCAFDGQFLTIQHVGALGRLSVGKGVKRVPLASISAVQIKPAGAVMSGFIQFTLPGSNERRSEFGKQTFDAAGDENSIVFIRDQEPAFLAFRDVLEQAIAARHSPVAAAAPAPAPTVLDQIAQLAGLRDAGVLTAEEFDAKKAELLSRL
ncbi:hypothetical protein Achl_4330 (plasmid) [Pseudarthrobacter chlorophenolicus A6]|uniref:SHOCT domain-containing protein n=1 Tax=Pseudarthrobacter chlorophenolicus (strain ATCC 700700 / DSM 12829 / CIP 107037 / JCM 12360 / KCTC 9906 / NCIMB 13794 / A6) TaxID=452863 RepID=B8HIN4_PSECP|nr:DUF4429 domain-containing protein [Pseudarthrobacter chlorophenolicus]ACL42281.1 hypothetical protein Achl_4330 [Pseudarthrobacter chlorophenolicus A6]SDQ15914.1 protein of unknown function [Pseudarthrobacter chlorophenolicus]